MNRTALIGALTLALCITACTPPSTPNPGPVNPGPVDPGPVTPTDPDLNVNLQPQTLYVAGPNQLTVTLDLSKTTPLSFKNGRVLSLEGTVPQGLTVTVSGSVITLTARPDLTQAVNATLLLRYGAPGQTPVAGTTLDIGSVATSTTPTPTPTDPDLGKVIPARAVTLDFSTRTATVDYSSVGLSFKNGRTLWVEIPGGGTPDGVYASVATGASTVNVGLFRSTDADATSQVPVTYREADGRVILSGTITVLHKADTPIVSDLSGWRAEERELLRLVNEVRTNQTLNGERVWAEGCISEFYPGDLKALLPLDSARLAALKHSSYLGLEGRDTTQEHGAHLEISSSTRFYATTLLERMQRAARESTDRAMPISGNENLIFGDEPFSPEEAVLGWIRSPDHCRNLISPKITYVGFALTEDGLTDVSPTTGWKRWARNYAMVGVATDN